MYSYLCDVYSGFLSGYVFSYSEYLKVMRHLYIFLSLVLCACASGCMSGLTGKSGNMTHGSGSEAGVARRDSMKPSRQPYEGFVWDEVRGAGLRLLAQRNGSMRVMADPSLPGMVLVRDGSASPVRLIQVFDIGDGGIGVLTDTLRARGELPAGETCRFRKIDSDRAGVSRYILVPHGDYAAHVDSVSAHGPVPSTCGGWGVGNSGMRYFEIHDSSPSKAVFVEIGQEMPLFDEKSITLADTVSDAMSRDVLYTLEGVLRMGHEVRSFVPSGSDKEYWVVDKTGKLGGMYDRVTGGKKNGSPVRAVLKLEYGGRRGDGFAEQYDGVWLVREVVRVASV